VEGPVSDFNSFFKKMSFVIVIAVVVFAVVGSFFISLFLRSLRRKESLIGEKVASETNTLAVAAKENAATSQDQNASIKEIVSTMEDNNELSGSISTKITDVASIANKTSSDVLDGVSALSKNVEQLHEIFDANQSTINGIKLLGEKIENIWEIVSLINSVADQAKIIAFNAELEASSAGEAGKNFHIVATEIRRLSDGIIDGTKEIKERISEIQQSSDSLILASENGTEKIKEGYGSARRLEDMFNSIKNSSEMTATSAEEITSIVQQQVISSNQILLTIKQIAAGVENSFRATESISVTAENLQRISQELNKQ
jgi:methyl-accepting chemotaxis protein